MYNVMATSVGKRQTTHWGINDKEDVAIGHESDINQSVSNSAGRNRPLPCSYKISSKSDASILYNNIDQINPTRFTGKKNSDLQDFKPSMNIFKNKYKFKPSFAPHDSCSGGGDVIRSSKNKQCNEQSPTDYDDPKVSSASTGLDSDVIFDKLRSYARFKRGPKETPTAQPCSNDFKFSPKTQESPKYDDENYIFPAGNTRLSLAEHCSDDSNRAIRNRNHGSHVLNYDNARNDSLFSEELNAGKRSYIDKRRYVETHPDPCVLAQTLKGIPVQNLMVCRPSSKCIHTTYQRAYDVEENLGEEELYNSFKGYNRRNRRSKNQPKSQVEYLDLPKNDLSKHSVANRRGGDPFIDVACADEESEERGGGSTGKPEDYLDDVLSRLMLVQECSSEVRSEIASKVLDMIRRRGGDSIQDNSIAVSEKCFSSEDDGNASERQNFSDSTHNRDAAEGSDFKYAHGMSSEVQVPPEADNTYKRDPYYEDFCLDPEDSVLLQGYTYHDKNQMGDGDIGSKIQSCADSCNAGNNFGPCADIGNGRNMYVSSNDMANSAGDAQLNRNQNSNPNSDSKIEEKTAYSSRLINFIKRVPTKMGITSDQKTALEVIKVDSDDDESAKTRRTVVQTTNVDGVSNFKSKRFRGKFNSHKSKPTSDVAKLSNCSSSVDPIRTNADSRKSKSQTSISADAKKARTTSVWTSISRNVDTLPERQFPKTKPRKITKSNTTMYDKYVRNSNKSFAKPKTFKFTSNPRDNRRTDGSPTRDLAWVSTRKQDPQVFESGKKIDEPSLVPSYPREPKDILKDMIRKRSKIYKNSSTRYEDKAAMSDTDLEITKSSKERSDMKPSAAVPSKSLGTQGIKRIANKVKTRKKNEMVIQDNSRLNPACFQTKSLIQSTFHTGDKTSALRKKKSDGALFVNKRMKSEIKEMRRNSGNVKSKSNQQVGDGTRKINNNRVDHSSDRIEETPSFPPLVSAAELKEERERLRAKNFSETTNPTQENKETVCGRDDSLGKPSVASTGCQPTGNVSDTKSTKQPQEKETKSKTSDNDDYVQVGKTQTKQESTGRFGILNPKIIMSSSSLESNEDKTEINEKKKTLQYDNIARDPCHINSQKQHASVPSTEHAGPIGDASPPKAIEKRDFEDFKRQCIDTSRSITNDYSQTLDIVLSNESPLIEMVGTGVLGHVGPLRKPLPRGSGRGSVCRSSAESCSKERAAILSKDVFKLDVYDEYPAQRSTERTQRNPTRFGILKPQVIRSAGSTYYKANEYITKRDDEKYSDEEEERYEDEEHSSKDNTTECNSTNGLITNNVTESDYSKHTTIDAEVQIQDSTVSEYKAPNTMHNVNISLGEATEAIKLPLKEAIEDMEKYMAIKKELEQQSAHFEHCLEVHTSASNEADVNVKTANTTDIDIRSLKYTSPKPIATKHNTESDFYETFESDLDKIENLLNKLSKLKSTNETGEMANDASKCASSSPKYIQDLGKNSGDTSPKKTQVLDNKNSALPSTSPNISDGDLLDLPTPKKSHVLDNSNASILSPEVINDLDTSKYYILSPQKVIDLDTGDIIAVSTSPSNPQCYNDITPSKTKINKDSGDFRSPSPRSKGSNDFDISKHVASCNKKVIEISSDEDVSSESSPSSTDSTASDTHIEAIDIIRDVSPSPKNSNGSMCSTKKVVELVTDNILSIPADPFHISEHQGSALSTHDKVSNDIDTRDMESPKYVTSQPDFKNPDSSDERKGRSPSPKDVRSTKSHRRRSSSPREVKSNKTPKSRSASPSVMLAKEVNSAETSKTKSLSPKHVKDLDTVKSISVGSKYVNNLDVSRDVSFSPKRSKNVSADGTLTSTKPVSDVNTQKPIKNNQTGKYAYPSPKDVEISEKNPVVKNVNDNDVKSYSPACKPKLTKHFNTSKDVSSIPKHYKNLDTAKASPRTTPTLSIDINNIVTPRIKQIQNLGINEGEDIVNISSPDTKPRLDIDNVFSPRSVDIQHIQSVQICDPTKTAEDKIHNTPKVASPSPKQLPYLDNDEVTKNRSPFIKHVFDSSRTSTPSPTRTNDNGTGSFATRTPKLTQCKESTPIHKSSKLIKESQSGKPRSPFIQHILDDSRQSSPLPDHVSDVGVNRLPISDAGGVSSGNKIHNSDPYDSLDKEETSCHKEANCGIQKEAILAEGDVVVNDTPLDEMVKDPNAKTMIGGIAYTVGCVLNSAMKIMHKNKDQPECDGGDGLPDIDDESIPRGIKHYNDKKDAHTHENKKECNTLVCTASGSVHDVSEDIRDNYTGVTAAIESLKKSKEAGQSCSEEDTSSQSDVSESDCSSHSDSVCSKMMDVSENDCSGHSSLSASSSSASVMSVESLSHIEENLKGINQKLEVLIAGSRNNINELVREIETMGVSGSETEMNNDNMIVACARDTTSDTTKEKVNTIKDSKSETDSIQSSVCSDQSFQSQSSDAGEESESQHSGSQTSVMTEESLSEIHEELREINDQLKSIVSKSQARLSSMSIESIAKTDDQLTEVSIQLSKDKCSKIESEPLAVQNVCDNDDYSSDSIGSASGGSLSDNANEKPMTPPPNKIISYYQAAKNSINAMVCGDAPTVQPESKPKEEKPKGKPRRHNVRSRFEPPTNSVELLRPVGSSPVDIAKELVAEIKVVDRAEDKPAMESSVDGIPDKSTSRPDPAFNIVRNKYLYQWMDPGMGQSNKKNIPTKVDSPRRVCSPEPKQYDSKSSRSSSPVKILMNISPTKIMSAAKEHVKSVTDRIPSPSIKLLNTPHTEHIQEHETVPSPKLQRLWQLVTGKSSNEPKEDQGDNSCEIRKEATPGIIRHIRELDTNSVPRVRSKSILDLVKVPTPSCSRHDSSKASDNADGDSRQITIIDKDISQSEMTGNMIEGKITSINGDSKLSKCKSDKAHLYEILSPPVSKVISNDDPSKNRRHQIKPGSLDEKQAKKEMSLIKHTMAELKARIQQLEEGLPPTPVDTKPGRGIGGYIFPEKEMFGFRRNARKVIDTLCTSLSGVDVRDCSGDETETKETLKTNSREQICASIRDGVHNLQSQLESTNLLQTNNVGIELNSMIEQMSKMDKSIKSVDKELSGVRQEMEQLQTHLSSPNQTDAEVGDNETTSMDSPIRDNPFLCKSSGAGVVAHFSSVDPQRSGVKGEGKLPSGFSLAADVYESIIDEISGIDASRSSPHHSFRCEPIGAPALGGTYMDQRVQVCECQHDNSDVSLSDSSSNDERDSSSSESNPSCCEPIVPTFVKSASSCSVLLSDSSSTNQEYLSCRGPTAPTLVTSCEGLSKAYNTKGGAVSERSSNDSLNSAYSSIIDGISRNGGFHPSMSSNILCETTMRNCSGADNIDGFPVLKQLDGRPVSPDIQRSPCSSSKCQTEVDIPVVETLPGVAVRDHHLREVKNSFDKSNCALEQSRHRSATGRKSPGHVESDININILTLFDSIDKLETEMQSAFDPDSQPLCKPLNETGLNEGGASADLCYSDGYPSSDDSLNNFEECYTIMQPSFPRDDSKTCLYTEGAISSHAGTEFTVQEINKGYMPDVKIHNIQDDKEADKRKLKLCGGFRMGGRFNEKSGQFEIGEIDNDLNGTHENSFDILKQLNISQNKASVPFPEYCSNQRRM